MADCKAMPMAVCGAGCAAAGGVGGGAGTALGVIAMASFKVCCHSGMSSSANSADKGGGASIFSFSGSVWAWAAARCPHTLRPLPAGVGSVVLFCHAGCGGTGAKAALWLPLCGHSVLTGTKGTSDSLIKRSLIDQVGASVMCKVGVLAVAAALMLNAGGTGAGAGTASGVDS